VFSHHVLPARWSAGLAPAGSHALLAPSCALSRRALSLPSASLPRLLDCWTGLRTRDALAGPRTCCRGRTLLPSRCCDERCHCWRPPLPLLLCRPAPHSAMLAPGHAETAGYPALLFPTGHPVELRFARPSDTATLCWPPALLSRSPRFQDSRYCRHSLFHSLAPGLAGAAVAHWTPSLSSLYWTSLLVLLLDPRSDIARTGPSVSASLRWTPVHHRIAGPTAMLVLLLDPRQCCAHTGPPVGSHTLYFPLRWCITLWGCQDRSFAHSASGLAGRALESRTRSQASLHRCWPAPATGIATLCGDSNYSL
jgi:hypothetical protein